MIKIENVGLASPEQMAFIIEGMRNPMNSWGKSDSYISHEFYFENKASHKVFKLKEADHSLMQRLSNAGTEHRKYMRMMPVYVRITAPLYWWKEFDTYKVGTVTNSCSTMHKIAEKEFTLEDFSCEHLLGGLNHYDEREVPYLDFSPLHDNSCTYSPSGILSCCIIPMLNLCRERYLAALKTQDETGLSTKDIWWQMIQLLPSSYNQTRNVMLNYEVLANIYRQRKGHKLDEWREVCKWIESLPCSELITGKGDSDNE